MNNISRISISQYIGRVRRKLRANQECKCVFVVVYICLLIYIIVHWITFTKAIFEFGTLRQRNEMKNKNTEFSQDLPKHYFINTKFEVGYH